MLNVGQAESSFRPSDDGKAASAKGGMVASAFPDATRAGVEMLKRGGNAVDAACATAFALGVCEPQASGIGGQSMCIMRINGRNVAVDGSSRSPSLAHSSAYTTRKRRSILGYKATTVPSTVAVLGILHGRYGRLEWQKVLAPAIRIAKRGYRITELQHGLQEKELGNFLGVRSKSGARYFLKDGQEPYDVGDRFVQDDLAHTLRAISDSGYLSFYRGSIAKQIDADMRRNGGLIREEDLAHIPEPIERRPISRKYRGVSITTMPPPAAGSTLLLTLMMLNHLPSRFLRSGKPSAYHFMAEALRKAFLHRVRRPFNPHTYGQMGEDAHHLQRSFARQMADSIHNSMDDTLPMIDPEFGGDEDGGGETTHLSVMDGEGNAAGITQSVELAYGSKAAADGMGFLYNNYMSAFEFSDPQNPFFIRPNEIPWTSVSPALIFRDGQLWMVLGSPGSQRIFSTVAQFLSGVIDGGLPINEAMVMPRLHCTIGGTISVEEGGFGGEVMRHLEEMGYKVVVRERFSFYHGAIHAVMKPQTREGFQGVAEIRRDGTAGGVS